MIAGSPLVPRHVRCTVYRLCGLKVRTNRINAWCRMGARLAIGKETFINQGCIFETAAKITIGENVFIGPQVTFVTSTHKLGGPNQRAGDFIAEQIHVGDGAWIGAGSLILPGADIGAGTVIAAGSVVRGKLEEDWLYAGVPATRKRHLDSNHISVVLPLQKQTGTLSR